MPKGLSPHASQTRKVLLPIAGMVLGIHALLLWGVPRLNRPKSSPPPQIAMETRLIQEPSAPPPSPATEPPPPKAPAQVPAPSPQPSPAPTPSVPDALPIPADTETETTPPAEPPDDADAEPAPSPTPAPGMDTSEEASGTDTARPIHVTPAGAAPLPPGTILPVTLPNSATLEFNASGQVKGFQYTAGAQLQWQHDGQYYQARQSISMFLMGERSQTSDGLITPQGLQPLNFKDQGRKTQSAAFDVAEGMARYSGGTANVPIADGVQDRLSVFLQLAAMISADPQHYPAGTLIELTTSSARSAVRWQFRVGAMETLELPFGSVMALRLDKLPGKGSGEQRGAVWLAPAMQYLPVRIRLTQGQDDFIDLQLKKYLPAPQ